MSFLLVASNSGVLHNAWCHMLMTDDNAEYISLADEPAYNTPSSFVYTDSVTGVSELWMSLNLRWYSLVKLNKIVLDVRSIISPSELAIVYWYMSTFQFNAIARFVYHMQTLTGKLIFSRNPLTSVRLDEESFFLPEAVPHTWHKEQCNNLTLLVRITR